MEVIGTGMGQDEVLRIMNRLGDICCAFDFIEMGPNPETAMAKARKALAKLRSAGVIESIDSCLATGRAGGTVKIFYKL